MLLKNSNTIIKPELYKWYEKSYNSNNFMSVLGNYKSLFEGGGPYGKGVSSYFPETIKLLIQKIPSNYYILCPLYSFGDFQIGVTGTSYFNESQVRTTYRELNEELGIFPKKYIPTMIKVHNNITTYGSNININHMRLNKKASKMTGKDDRNNKIAVIVYGEEQDILDKYLTKNIIQFQSTDNIVGVMSIPMTAVYKYLEV